MVTLYCKETPGLKLGPGPANDPTTIRFVDGWAELPDGDARLQWVFLPGTPHIEVIEEEGRVPATAPDAHVCETCGAAFDSKRRLNGHLLSHRG